MNETHEVGISLLQIRESAMKAPHTAFHSMGGPDKNATRTFNPLKDLGTSGLSTSGPALGIGMAKPATSAPMQEPKPKKVKVPKSKPPYVWILTFRSRDRILPNKQYSSQDVVAAVQMWGAQRAAGRKKIFVRNLTIAEMQGPKDPFDGYILVIQSEFEYMESFEMICGQGGIAEWLASRLNQQCVTVNSVNGQEGMKGWMEPGTTLSPATMPSR